MRATMITIDAMFGSSQQEHEEDLLRGLGASAGSYEGPARRVAGPTEFDRIQKGDVLVTESTSEASPIASWRAASWTSRIRRASPPRSSGTTRGRS